MESGTQRVHGYAGETHGTCTFRVPSTHMSHSWKQQVKPRMWFNLRSVAWQGRGVRSLTRTCRGPQVCTGAPHPLLPGGLNQLTPSVMNI